MQSLDQRFGSIETRFAEMPQATLDCNNGVAEEAREQGALMASSQPSAPCDSRAGGLVAVVTQVLALLEALGVALGGSAQDARLVVSHTALEDVKMLMGRVVDGLVLAKKVGGGFQGFSSASRVGNAVFGAFLLIMVWCM